MCVVLGYRARVRLQFRPDLLFLYLSVITGDVLTSTNWERQYSGQLTFDAQAGEQAGSWHVGPAWSSSLKTHEEQHKSDGSAWAVRQDGPLRPDLARKLEAHASALGEDKVLASDAHTAQVDALLSQFGTSGHSEYDFARTKDTCEDQWVFGAVKSTVEERGMSGEVVDKLTLNHGTKVEGKEVVTRITATEARATFHDVLERDINTRSWFSSDTERKRFVPGQERTLTPSVTKTTDVALSSNADGSALAEPRSSKFVDGNLKCVRVEKDMLRVDSTVVTDNKQAHSMSKESSSVVLGGFTVDGQSDVVVSDAGVDRPGVIKIEFDRRLQAGTHADLRSESTDGGPVTSFAAGEKRIREELREQRDDHVTEIKRADAGPLYTKTLGEARTLEGVTGSLRIDAMSERTTVSESCQFESQLFTKSAETCMNGLFTLEAAPTVLADSLGTFGSGARPARVTDSVKEIVKGQADATLAYGSCSVPSPSELKSAAPAVTPYELYDAGADLKLNAKTKTVEKTRRYVGETKNGKRAALLTRGGPVKGSTQSFHTVEDIHRDTSDTSKAEGASGTCADAPSAPTPAATHSSRERKMLGTEVSKVKVSEVRATAPKSRGLLVNSEVKSVKTEKGITDTVALAAKDAIDVTGGPSTVSYDPTHTRIEKTKVQSGGLFRDKVTSTKSKLTVDSDTGNVLSTATPEVKTKHVPSAGTLGAVASVAGGVTNILTRSIDQGKIDVSGKDAANLTLSAVSGFVSGHLDNLTSVETDSGSPALSLAKVFVFHT